MGTLTRRGIVAALLLSAVATAPAAAADDPGWEPAVTLGSVTEADRVDILPGSVLVTDAGGTDTLAWLESSTANGVQQVFVSRRAAGGSWSPPEALGSLRGNRTPGLATTPDGHVLATWVHDRRGPTGVSKGSAVLTASFDGTSWSSPQTLWHGRALVARAVPAVDATGRAAVLWDRTDAILARVRSAAGAWSTPVRLDDPAGSFVFAAGLGMDDRGRAIAAWGDLRNRVWTRRWTGTRWKPQHRLVAHLAHTFTLVVTHDGTAATAFTSGADSLVKARLMTAGGMWGPAVTIDDRRGDSFPNVALAPRPDGWGLAWSRRRQLSLREYDGSTWQPTTLVRRVKVGSRGNQLAYRADGDAVLVWNDVVAASGDLPVRQVLSVTRTDGVWSTTPTALSGATSSLQDLRLATQDGHVTASWVDVTGLRDHILAATGTWGAPIP